MDAEAERQQGVIDAEVAVSAAAMREGPDHWDLLTSHEPDRGQCAGCAGLAEQRQLLDQRHGHLDKRARLLAQREQLLDELRRQLDNRKRLLDQREQELERREREIDQREIDHELLHEDAC